MVGCDLEKATVCMASIEATLTIDLLSTCEETQGIVCGSVNLSSLDFENPYIYIIV